jgi:integrase/recombinase XerD
MLESAVTQNRNLPALRTESGAIGSPTPPSGAPLLPAHIARQGESAAKRFFEFFAAEIENDNTRATYYRAVQNFFLWCEGRGFHELESIGPVVVAAYIKEEKTRRGHNGVQTVKVELAALRRLFDYLVIGQVMPFNPALSVRGPKHVVTKGKTPVLSGEETKRLIESIPTQRKDGSPDLVGLRDRALISLMTYSLGRVSAVLKMEVRDYRPQGKRFKVHLHEKGGKVHEVPVHHKAEEYLDAYIEAAGIGDQARGPLWRKGLKRTGTLQDKAMTRFDVFHMVRRRALAAGISEEICCHTFRATGITVFRKNGGTIEDARQIAGHSSARTTQLYDRSESEISLEEIERIRL